LDISDAETIAEGGAVRASEAEVEADEEKDD
jgi:hypothetical protein